MTAIEICYSVLLLAGAFALVSLGIFFIRSAVAVKQMGETAKQIQTTIAKVNIVADDLAYKLDLLNAPIETIYNFFKPVKRSKSYSFFKKIWNIF